MSSLDERPLAGKQYWRSLDDLADTPEFREFLQREFPKGAAEMLEGTDRRHFLRIMGASMALAGMGLSGCRRWPQEQIAPFASRPAGRTPGDARQFATSMEIGGVAQGLLVTSYDGRPIEIEGNPEHPINRGATDAFAQASYESQIVLKPLPRGTHNIRVVLASNDHSLVNPVVEAGVVVNIVSSAEVTANELELDY